MRLRSASPIQWSRPASPQPRLQALAAKWYVSQEALRQILDTPDLNLADIAFVAAEKWQLPDRRRARTEQIVNTQLFQDWIVSPSSAKLLVQWDFHLPKIIAGISPLSVFCATLAQALRTRERFVSVVWFCGRHVDPTDPGARIGARAMLLSLIDQLLRQHTFDLQLLHHDVDLAYLQAARLDELIKLLGWLVRQLPQAVTLFCIIDGVALFEREDFEAEALEVFSSLLRLAGDGDGAMPATVKVLFTSTPGTDTVRAAFEHEDLILDVEGLPRLAWVANEERMVRELEGEFGEGSST